MRVPVGGRSGAGIRLGDVADTAADVQVAADASPGTMRLREPARRLAVLIMDGRIERRIEREIRQATERGDFENLAGAGKPLPGAGEALAEDWWLHDKLRREKLGADVLPTTLRLRKAVEDIGATVAKLRTEAEVRAAVAELNDKVRAARLGPVDGPPVALHTADADAVVEAWRARS